MDSFEVADALPEAKAWNWGKSLTQLITTIAGSESTS